ncbi:hypothetical protein ASPZODRAFT_163206 [Penicilliopsis zonata CBS 506.65]|uniref:Uncharacterized protein n=1 Tax=Penicilliopsis zonata CBS 506.65 TaxID=1073090 RepID=A0A1L9SW77_9EURO|nr:hypothetical protein ASPZODRAFT_163206 [Penicilliopsis zonata CBS 506.65]OJJ51357.1 hypothetical protein ASPZODRAFT_163206 [Penicilliopsis zonata CBS 506.65]
MSRLNQDAREQVTFLCEKLCGKNGLKLVDQDGHFGDLRRLNIHHDTQYDFESLNSEAACLDQDPPFLFYPLPQEILNRYPLDPQGFKDGYFFEYNPDIPSTLKLRIDERTRGACSFVSEWATRFRPGLPAGTTSLLDIVKLEEISHPNPFLLESSFFGYYWIPSIYWDTYPSLEPERQDNQYTFSQVTLQTFQPLVGKEDSILFGEMGALLSGLKSRVNQPKVDDEQVQEALSNDPSMASDFELAFPDEEHFPVLMLSYVGPQHGRLFYAYMDGKQLIIQQSKLYGFEKKSTAPVELFARMLLSRPLALPDS